MCIPLAPIILGHLARSEINKSQGRVSGAGMALTGLILGYLNLFIFPLIGIVSFCAVANLEETFEAGKEQTAEVWVNGAGKAYVNTYFVIAGSYPQSLNDLMIPPRVGVNPVVNRSSALLDPWGQEYLYKYPGTRNPQSFDLWTTTPDGQVIGNWDGF
jgi:general secretion pathway protein G